MAYVGKVAGLAVGGFLSVAAIATGYEKTKDISGENVIYTACEPYFTSDVSGVPARIQGKIICVRDGIAPPRADVLDEGTAVPVLTRLTFAPKYNP